MVKVNVGGKEFYLNSYWKKQLDNAKRVVEKDSDFVFIVDGREGVGKSVLAQTTGFYLDPTLDLSRITFTPEEFRDAVVKAKQYQCVIFDEAITGLYSRNALNKVNTTLIQMLAQCRQKNLYIIIVLPTFYDLDRNIALWRTNILLHCYKDKKTGRRGQFLVFGDKKKKKMFAFGKQTYNYSVVKPDQRPLNFVKFYAVDEKEYREKKFKTLSTYGFEKKEPSVMEKKRSRMTASVIRLLKDKLNYSDRQIAKETGMANSTISRMLKEDNNNTDSNLPILN